MKYIETAVDWLSIGTEIDIDQLEDYLNTLVRQLKQMADEYDRKIELEASKIEDENEQQDFYEFASEDHWNFRDNFPRILLNSFLVSIFSFLETELNSVASQIGKKQNQVFDVGEIRGKDYLESACLYIKKLTNIECKTFQTWVILIEGRRLRNIITHSNGEVTKSEDIQTARKYNVINTNTIELTSGRKKYEISINKVFAQTYLVTVREFFKELYNAIRVGNYL